MKSMPSFFALAFAGSVTWNPSDKGANVTLSGSNLVATRASGSLGYSAVRATSSKYYTGQGYFEVAITAMEVGSPYIIVGIANSSATLNDHVGSDANGWGYYGADGSKFNNDTATAYGAAFAQGSVIGVAFNNGKVWFAKNNTWNGSPASDTGEAFSGITGEIFPIVSVYDGIISAVDSVTARFKSSSLSYSPPSGFSAWDAS